MKIKDIAYDLHLSVSTVSKALNGAFDVSNETKQLVLDYAKKVGYKARDQRLKTTKKRRLCIIHSVDNLINPSSLFMALSVAFSKYAGENNFEVIQVGAHQIGESYDDYLKDNHFDGAFILGLNYESPLLNKIKGTNIPTVLFDNIVEGDKISSINNENLNTISKLVTLLHNKGHNKIGFIHGDRSSFISNERYAGYIIGLEMNGIAYNPNYIYFGSYNEESGYKAASFFKNTDVSAIVCSSDSIAIGLIRGLKDFGISCPEDVSITGYDDLEIASYFTPPLTTVRQDLDLIGNRAFDLLVSMLMNRTNQRIVIFSDIIIRESIRNIL